MANKEIIFRFAIKDKEALALVRQISGLKVSESGQTIWLRGIPFSEDLDPLLAGLPAIARFYTYSDESDLLFPLGSFTPREKLPMLQWMPIADYITVAMPPAALPGIVEEQYQVRLQRTETISPAYALLTRLDILKVYIELAPDTRLEVLRYIVSDKGHCLIFGNPLPALPGKEFYLHQDILLPAGFKLEIEVLASLLKAQLDPEGEAFILFDEDGAVHRILKNDLMPVSRSSVRATR